jgi:acetyl-CoA carboxylase biotin carboxyl carrier protein
MTPAQLDAIKKLIDLLADSQAGEIEVTDGDFKVRVVAVRAGVGHAGRPAGPSSQPSRLAKAEASASTDRIVRAGLHGILHHAPTPNAAPFVQTGVTVAKGQQLCILEAMKVFTQVNAPCSGVVRKVHAENGQNVAAGDPLYTLEPTAE